MLTSTSETTAGDAALEPPVAERKRPPLASRGRSARRLMARYRRPATLAFLFLPVLLVLAMDFESRGQRLLGLPPRYVASYLFAVVESALLWGLLLRSSSARRGPVRWVTGALFVVLSTLALGGQLYFRSQYSTYLNLDATLFGTSLSASLFGQLRADGWNFFMSVLPPLIASIVLLIGARYLQRPGPRTAWRAHAGAFVLVVAVFFIPCSYRTVQASTPDVIYFHAIGGLMKQLTGVHQTTQIRPGLRTVPQLPALSARPAVPERNVILILTESVRADAHCSAYTPTCAVTPATNAAAPGRLPLLQMRSNSSTTATELAVLWSGLVPTESREALHSAPLLFDYARAAGYDNSYWTSHHMMFANSRLFVQDLPTSHKCGATDLDPLADIDLGAYDELLTARALRDLAQMTAPFFGVVHVGNTHVPYRVDPDDSPFQPATESKAPSDNDAYHNYYRNAVYLQDKTLGAFIRDLRATPEGARTILVFTSDHGEAFREHGQVGHTGAVLDEEIHVPFWIDAPEGTLTASERAGLESARDRIAFHTDVTPTILDLLGLWDAPELAPYRAKMIGQSLLVPHPERAGRAESMPAVPLSNCTQIWGCAFQNWGLMRGAMKLEAREWDSTWRCYDVLADPEEKRDLGPGGCGDLPSLAHGIFGRLPSATE